MTKNILILIAFILVASTSNWVPVYTDVTLTGQGTEDSPLKVDTSRVATSYDLVSAAGGGASYDVYTAILTQTGTSAPTAIVLENTLGGTVVWSYVSAGNYRATLSGVFTADKTIPMLLQNYNWDGMADNNMRWGTSSYCVLTIAAGDDFIAAGNEAFVEIRVYP